jgi:hypothetical protein
MASRHQPDPFLDLAADAVAAREQFEQAQHDLDQLRPQLRTALAAAQDRADLAEGPARRIGACIQQGNFERARQLYREHAEMEAHA